MQKSNMGRRRFVGFYPHFVGAMRGICYNGYLSYELCPLPKWVGIEYAEKSAQLATEFMRGLVSSTAA
jgi:hypothetical protein